MDNNYYAILTASHYDSSRPYTSSSSSSSSSTTTSLTSSPRPPLTPINLQPNSLSLSGTMPQVLIPLEALRLSSSCSSLPSIGGLRASPVRMASPVEKRRETMPEQSAHNLKLTCFPNTTRYPYVAGTTGVQALLERNVGPMLYNREYSEGLFHRELYVNSPKTHIGVHTAVLRFCQQTGQVMSVLRYDAHDWQKEQSKEFWTSVYDCAEKHSPCIIVVHHASKHIHVDACRTVYEWIYHTWKVRKPRTALTWLLFVDNTPPWLLEKNWNQFAPDQMTEYIYPPPAERRQMLRCLIDMRLQTLCPLGIDAVYVASKLQEYDRCLDECLQPVSKNEELELGSLETAVQFVRALFLMAAHRAPSLASASLTVASLKDALPDVSDFSAVIKTFQRRRMQINVIELDRLLTSTAATSTAEMTPTSMPPGWDAMN